MSRRWRSFSGEHSLDLDGEGPGTIRTSIDAIPGEYYRLTFELTGNCDQAPNERGTAVTIGSTTEPSSINASSTATNRGLRPGCSGLRYDDRHRLRVALEPRFQKWSGHRPGDGHVCRRTDQRAGEYPAIQGAIDNAPAGAIIEVDPGTYGPFDLATPTT